MVSAHFLHSQAIAKMYETLDWVYFSDLLHGGAQKPEHTQPKECLQKFDCNLRCHSKLMPIPSPPVKRPTRSLKSTNSKKIFMEMLNHRSSELLYKSRSEVAETLLVSGCNRFPITEWEKFGRSVNFLTIQPAKIHKSKR